MDVLCIKKQLARYTNKTVCIERYTTAAPHRRFPHAPELDPLTEVGSGSVREKQQAYLHEIIEQLMDAQEVLSKRTLNSDEVREGLKRWLLDHFQLYEKLRQRAQSA